MTEAEKIKRTCDLLGLTPRKLAKAMHITPNTMYRWIAGSHKPKGLSASVLEGLHQVATVLHQRDVDDKTGMPDRAKRAGARVSLGIGAVLFYGLGSLKKA